MDNLLITSNAAKKIIELSKKEAKSVILITRKNKIIAEEFPISKIPLVSTISGKMNILRVYTQQNNRKKVEIAAKSILSEIE